MYEGAPNWPEEDRFWALIEKYGVTILYTAPTAIRAFIKWGDHHVDKHDLTSLRLLGSVGEGINPEAWMWYHRKIGGGRCPIVDTWWQTETGGIMMSPLPGAIATKPGSCTKPLPGIRPRIVDDKGHDVPAGRGGMLCVDTPWPGMLRGIWGDDARYKEQYWTKVPGMYLTGDNARCDSDGYYWIMGRIDDVINVAGHRLSTIEVESALVSIRLSLKLQWSVNLMRFAARPSLRSSLCAAASPTSNCGRRCACTCARKSAPWRNRTMYTSPLPYPRHEVVRLCVGCCATLLPAKSKLAIPVRSKIIQCWPNCAGTKNPRSI